MVNWPGVMHIQQLSLTNFRLYARLEVDLPAGALILVGSNAQGKTALLEALYFLATGQSHHAASERQLINFLALQEPQPFARVVAEARSARERVRVELRVIAEMGGEGRLRKEVLLNGAKKRLADLAGRITAVMFLPQDMAIVEGSPSERRHYLDVALCQVDSIYQHNLSEYGKVLSQRNALLKQIQESGVSPDLLDFWDGKLCELAGQLQAARTHAVAELEALASPIHRELTAGKEGLRLAYHPSFDPSAAAAPEGQLGLPLSTPVHTLGLSAADIETLLCERLKASRSDEIARGQTLYGPHRDELRFVANGLDVGVYGSRGQVRTAVLALKLAETEWMRQRTGEWPILLLDEVLSELDAQRRSDLLRRLSAADQFVITTTDLAPFPPEFLGRATVWRVRSGSVSPE